MNQRFASFLLFLNYLSTGLLTPVMSLMVLEQGITLGQLALALGIYSATVLVLEVPSGIACDMVGRKGVFVLSQVLQIPAFWLVSHSGNALWICAIGFIFYGTARAFSTGSLEAMLIDAAIERDGKAGLPRITSNLMVAEGTGLAVGSLIGGALPSIFSVEGAAGSLYIGNLWGKLLLSGAIALLAWFGIHGDYKSKEERPKLGQHLREAAMAISQSSIIQGVLISMVATGFFFAGLETYWQPRLLELLPNQSYLWMTGVLACLYFACSLGGSALVRIVMERWQQSILPVLLYFGCRSFMCVALMLLAAQQGLGGFVVFYCATYLMMGSANVVEGVLLNSETPSSMRSSMISVSSLLMQCGAMVASLLFGWMMNFSTILEVWFVAAVMIGVSAVLMLMKAGKKGAQLRLTPKEEEACS